MSESNISPSEVLARVAEQIPPDCLENMIIIGSLAAGYHFFANDRDLYVRTKDIDSVLCPRREAVRSGRDVAEQLLRNGWQHRQAGSHAEPGTIDTPDEDLPAVRLEPPDSSEWFLEFLTEPERGDASGRRWLRLELSTGHFGLPSFTCLALTTFRPVKTPFGLYCARPSMMALANLLEHRKIGDELMSGLIAKRKIKRSNKDLGRVVALARLSSEEAVEVWTEEWEEALQQVFPGTWKTRAREAGDGLRALLASSDDLEEAVHTCNNGLLAARPVTIEQLRIAGQRLLYDAVEPLEAIGEKG
jgi:hypothetical protein